MSTFVLVVEWQIPDDTPNQDVQDAIVAMANKIHAEAPAQAERVTAYTGVDAAVIAEAARVGAVVSQADRLAIKPGDVITIRLPDYATDEDFDLVRETASTAFPGHRVIVLAPGTTITTAPATEAATS